MPELQALFATFGFDYLTNAHKRIYWVFILSAAVIALFYIIYNKEKPKDYLKKSYWFHSSAVLDYRYFILVSLIKFSLIFPVMLSVSETSLFFLAQLQNVFGYHTPGHLNREIIVLLYTFALFVFGDLSRYALHRWMHSSDILWQFHKVHHSAEVLTPMTFYRVHPVENFLFALRYTLVTGLVTGVFVYWFGARLQLLDVIGVNVFLFISMLLGANLRHSAIALSYPQWLENWLISPAQHQLHHTPMGARSNYAGVLALWDRLFNSLHYSDKNKLTIYGLSNENIKQQSRNSYTSLSKLIFNPFINIYFLFKKENDNPILIGEKK